MTAKELLVPRFKIIIGYPRSEFKEGDILVRIKGSTNDIYHTDENAFVGGIDLEEIEKYPKIFQKLNWWEHRSVKDMPKRLICKAIKDDTDVSEIEEWDMEMLIGWTNKEKRTCCSLRSFNPEYGYFPVD